MEGSGPVRVQPSPAPIMDEAIEGALRNWASVAKEVKVAVKIECVEVRLKLVAAKGGLDATQAQTVVIGDKVMELEAKLRQAIKAKVEGPSGSGTLMLISTEV
ncbi:hypothetical protein ACLOJK_006054 [Asimina triloba]